MAGLWLAEQEMTLNEQLPAPREPKAPRKRTVSRRVRHACDLLISGECKTIKAAASRAGLSREHLSRTLRTSHGHLYWTQRARETILAAAPIAAQRLTELMHGESEHVSFKASEHILGIEGIKPAEKPLQVVNNFQQAGFLVDWRNGRDPRPLREDEQAIVDAIERGEATGGVIGRDAPYDTRSPAKEPGTIEHQGEGEDDDTGR